MWSRCTGCASTAAAPTWPPDPPVFASAAPGQRGPGMKKTRLARRLGLDGNPLRRRIDKIAACLAALLMAVFLTGAPMLSVAAARWAGHAAATAQRAARSWHRVPAVLLRGAPLPALGWAFGSSWVRPGGPHRTDRSGRA